MTAAPASSPSTTISKPSASANIAESKLKLGRPPEMGVTSYDSTFIWTTPPGGPISSRTRNFRSSLSDPESPANTVAPSAIAVTAASMLFGATIVIVPLRRAKRADLTHERSDAPLPRRAARGPTDAQQSRPTAASAASRALPSAPAPRPRQPERLRGGFGNRRVRRTVGGHLPHQRLPGHDARTNV